MNAWQRHVNAQAGRLLCPEVFWRRASVLVGAAGMLQFCCVTTIAAKCRDNVGSRSESCNSLTARCDCHHFEQTEAFLLSRVSTSPFKLKSLDCAEVLPPTASQIKEHSLTVAAQHLFFLLGPAAQYECLPSCVSRFVVRAVRAGCAPPRPPCRCSRGGRVATCTPAAQHLSFWRQSRRTCRRAQTCSPPFFP